MSLFITVWFWAFLTGIIQLQLKAEKCWCKGFSEPQLRGREWRISEQRKRACRSNEPSFTPKWRCRPNFLSPSPHSKLSYIPAFLKITLSFSLHCELELLAPSVWTHQLCLHQVQDQTRPEIKTVKFNLKKEGFYLVWFLQMWTSGRQANVMYHIIAVLCLGL